MVEKKWSLVARPSGKICWNSFSASVAASFALHLPDFTFSSMYSRIDLSLHLSYRIGSFWKAGSWDQLLTFLFIKNTYQLTRIAKSTHLSQLRQRQSSNVDSLLGMRRLTTNNNPHSTILTIGQQ